MHRTCRFRTRFCAGCQAHRPTGPRAGHAAAGWRRRRRVGDAHPAGAEGAARLSEPQARLAPSNAPRVQLARFEDLIALAQVNRDILLKMALERDVRLVRFERGTLEFALAPGGSPQLASNLMRRLQEWTGERWMVAISSSPGAPTIRELNDAREREPRHGRAGRSACA